MKAEQMFMSGFSREEAVHFVLEDCADLFLFELLELPEQDIRKALRCLPKHKFELLGKLRQEEYEDKFLQRRPKNLAGNLPRTWSKEQVVEFFTGWPAHLEHARLALLQQFFYGLRVGEIGSARIVPGQQLVQVLNHKCGRVEYLPLLPGTEVLFQHQKVTASYLQNCFRQRLYSLGGSWTFQYAVDRAGRMRHQYSTHSLRRTPANLLFMKTGSAYKAGCLLRHSLNREFGATSAYLHYSHEQMLSDMQDAYGELVPLLVPSTLPPKVKAPVTRKEQRRFKRSFTDEQLNLFFSSFPSGDMKKTLLRQFFYGLKLDELNNCRITDRGTVLIAYKRGSIQDVREVPLIPGTEELFSTPNYHPSSIRKSYTRHVQSLGVTLPSGTESLRMTAASIVWSATNKENAKKYLQHREQTQQAFTLSKCFREYVKQLTGETQ